MCHRSVVLAVLVFPLAIGVSGCAQPEVEIASFSAQDAGAVRTNLDTYLSADPIDAPETFFSQFTEDVYWVFADQTPWVGTQGLQGVEWCHTLSSEITADRVEGSGDLAYARGTYRLSLDCGGDTPVDREGVFLSVHRRQEDGTWRIESLLQPQ
jgi:ketosteroid isomerase-like protein